MSAYMHDSAHIDALVHAAFRFASFDMSYRTTLDNSEPVEWVTLRRFDAAAGTELGRMLLRENAESMAYRYNMKDMDSDADDGTRPIEYLGYLAQADEYVYSINDARKPWRVLPAVAILKALDSYEYQSCEHPEWRASTARAFCDALRGVLIQALPGYTDADTWSICEHALT